MDTDILMIYVVRPAGLTTCLLVYSSQSACQSASLLAYSLFSLSDHFSVARLCT